MRYSGPVKPMLLVVAVLAAGACASAPPARAILCMPSPSACGFPDATTAGVTPGTPPLTPASGVVTLSTPGQVYENREVTGSIIVTAPNVTIRNVRLINMDPYYAVSVKNGNSWDNTQANLLLDHVEINLNGHLDIKGIAFNGYTARNVLFHNGADCAHFGVNVVIEGSVCALGPDTNGDGTPDSAGFCSGTDHFDGFQSDGGNNITLRRNTIRNPCGQTSAILMSTNTSPIDTVVIDNNLVSGGGYTIYCGTTSGGVATHETYTNNVTSKEYYPKGGYYGPTDECEKVAVSGGNVWDGSYVPPAGAGGGPTAPGSTSAGSTSASGKVYLLSAARATRLTRSVLARELGRRYTRRAKGLRLSCHRGSKSALTCGVKWRGRRQHGVFHRYSGSVIVMRVAVARWQYSLRVRSWSSGCGCSQVVKRKGAL